MRNGPRECWLQSTVMATNQDASTADSASEAAAHGGVDLYLDALASSAPTPGGGSAAAMIGAVAAALVAMVARLTAGRPAFAAVDADARRIIIAADAAREALAGAMASDEDAFRAVMAAYRLPRTGDGAREARREAIAQASRMATAPPLTTARLARTVLDLALEASRIGNPTVTSDAAVAAWAALAAIRASAVNVRINLPASRDAEFSAAAEAEIATLIDGAIEVAEATERAAATSQPPAS